MIASFSRTTLSRTLWFSNATKRCRPGYNKLCLDNFEKFQIGNLKNLDETPERSQRCEVWSWSQHFLRLSDTAAHFLLELVSLLSPLFLQTHKNTHDQDLLFICKRIWWGLKHSQQLQRLQETHRWDQRA